MQTPTLTTQTTPTLRNRKIVNVLLWILQILLAALFLFAGGMKLVVPVETMTAQSPLPGWFIRLIGVAEVLGGVGLVLPELLRIYPILTPLAAAGVTVIMVGAVALGLMSGGIAGAAFPFAVGVFSCLVACGRWRMLTESRGRE